MINVGFSHPDCASNTHRGVELLGNMLRLIFPPELFKLEAKPGTTTTSTQLEGQAGGDKRKAAEMEASLAAQSWENA
eukprot:8029613-Karenia_brevis.AAC.1